MENAKTEFLNLIGDRKLICATISFKKSFCSDTNEGEFNLQRYYTNWEYEEFLANIDRNYNDGYGGQELFGTVWFEDGIWAERGEYDGSEWWKLKQYPEIPKELLK